MKTEQGDFMIFLRAIAYNECYSARYAIARPSVRPSLCLSVLSVRLSVTRVDQLNTVEVRIMQLSPQSSPMISILTVNFTANGEVPKGK